MPTAYDKLIRVQITQPGMQNYNGYLRRHLFKDGKSVEEIPVRMALLLGASCTCVDEDGNVLNPNTYKFEQLGEVSAADFPSVAVVRQSDVDAAELAAVEEEAGPALSGEPMEDDDGGFVDDTVGFHEPGDEHEDPRVWSLSELEAIADANGISGLREVGDVLKVKGRSIGDLIQSILSSQTANPASDGDKFDGAKEISPSDSDGPDAKE